MTYNFADDDDYEPYDEEAKMAELVELSRSSILEDRIQVAQDFRTPEDVLWELLHQDEPLLNNAVAGNPNLPENIVDFLLRTKDEAVLDNLVFNHYLSKKLFNKIFDAVVDSGNFFGRIVPLASSEHVTFSQAEMLISHLSSTILDDNIDLQRIVMNTENVELLNGLSSHTDEKIVRLVAGNKHTPQDTLKKLLHHENSSVVSKALTEAIISSEELSDIIHKVTKYHFDISKYLFVSEIVHPDIVNYWVEKFFYQFDKTVWNMYARCASANPERLHELALDVNRPAGIEKWVTKNPTASLKTLTHFASSTDNEIVRKNVAENPSTTVELLDMLTEDDNVWVQVSALESLRCTEPFVRKALKNAGNEIELRAYALCYRNFFPEYADWPEEWVAAHYDIPVSYYSALKKLEV